MASSTSTAMEPCAGEPDPHVGTTHNRPPCPVEIHDDILQRGVRADHAPAVSDLATPADVAALATTTNTWRATQVRRYGCTDNVRLIQASE
jgi:hypothetical protein